MHPDPVRDGRFAAALLASDLPPPDGLIGSFGQVPHKRFAVYRNNVVVSLIDALASIFPTVQNLIGEEFFRALARLYITDNPPASPLLFRYGAGFPAFLQAFPPLADLPYLPEVAELERLWLDAYHAADALPLAPEALAAISPEALANIVFAPHPATRLLSARHAVGSILIHDRKQQPLSGIDPGMPEAILITRPQFDVDVTVLPRGGSSFFAALLAGGTLGQAFAAAATDNADLPSLIGIGLSSGAFTSVQIAEERPSP